MSADDEDWRDNPWIADDLRDIPRLNETFVGWPVIDPRQLVPVVEVHEYHDEGHWAPQFVRVATVIEGVPFTRR